MVRPQRFVLAGVTMTLLTLALAGCAAPPAGQPELLLGTILPATGSLDRFGPIMTAGANAARDQVNDAGGAAGMRIRLVHEDSQTQPAAGTAAANKLKADGVAAIVGAAASGVSKAVLEVTRPNRIVQISPASTSPEFTTIMQGLGAGDRYWFRTTPSDALQGRVAGAYAIAKNWSRVVVLYDNNPYGNGLRATFTEAFQGASVGTGGASARVASGYGFEEQQTSYDSVLQQALGSCTAAARATCPSGVFFAGYPREALQMLKDWWAKSDWRGIPWLFSEGVQEQTFFDDVRAQGITPIQPFEGTAPVGIGPRFDDYKNLPGANTGLFGPHTFDATMVIALAAQKAGSRDGTAIRDAIRMVANPPGEMVGPADFARAKQLLEQGQDIDYEGAAGSQNFDEFGDVTSSYEVYTIGDDGKLARKCLVPEDRVTQSPVTLPADCVQAPARPPGPPTTPPATPPSPPPAGNQTNQTANLTMTARQSGCPVSYCWEPADATVASGARVTATLVNPAGNIGHSLCFEFPPSGASDDPCTPNATSATATPGGQSATVGFDAPAAGAYVYYCGVPGHRALGMEGTLTVT